ncbi:MAG: caspase family protein [Verrucomicrobiaceae bacterium]|nr:caspase family protein [Verrucomicrobiaceae bacterium]
MKHRACLLFLLLVSAMRASAADRVALVVGNGAYESARLPNPANDAALISRSLARVGFKVIQKTDLGREALMTAVREFSDSLKKNDVALFFYAGHGAQVKGENFLIPVDTPPGMKEFEAQHRSVSANLVLGAMEESGSRLNIVILDCCRDNPFARGWRSSSSGLAEMKAPQETLIGYATAPGSAALDGEGSNSPYSLALAQEMIVPKRKLEEVFKQVARRVFESTKGAQRPWISLDVLGEFSFMETAVQEVKIEEGKDKGISHDIPVTNAKPIVWSKGTLKAELESFWLSSSTKATAVVKLTNTSPDKTLKIAFDWENPSGYSPNPPPGSTLNTPSGASLTCTSSNGITPLTFLNATDTSGALSNPTAVIAQASELGPKNEITLTLNYGLASDQRGFRTSADRDQKPASNGPPPPNAKHRLTLGLWQAEMKGESFGRPASISIQFNDIPQFAP